jgi:hypothetical protein
LRSKPPPAQPRKLQRWARQARVSTAPPPLYKVRPYIKGSPRWFATGAFFCADAPL